jgi:hypothetical protein
MRLVMQSAFDTDMQSCRHQRRRRMLLARNTQLGPALQTILGLYTASAEQESSPIPGGVAMHGRLTATG